MSAAAEPRKLPAASYRLQLRDDFGFDAVADVADYLAVLGVSHIYTSPFLQAAAGSTHGYDGVDPTVVSAELGGDDAHARMQQALRRHGLGLVIDLVPNHLSTADPRNRWWWDVLRHGPDSPYAPYFDIDWHPPQADLAGKVLVPVLGAPLAEELSAGTVRVECGEEPAVAYHDMRFPLSPGTWTGKPDEQLTAPLDRQHYVLAHWRRGLTDLNYRRFFDITTLVALRVESPQVFDDVHRLALSWCAANEVDGLRVDHIDGLADPAAYLDRLASAAPGAWLCVEKILEEGEELDGSWPVHGTTGYDALSDLTKLQVDTAAAAVIDAAYTEIVGRDEDFHEVARRSRLEAVRNLLAPELARCTRALVAAAADLDVDLATDEAETAVEAYVAELPVYRTYVRAGEPASVQDREVVVDTVTRVFAHDPEVSARAVHVLAEAFHDPPPVDTSAAELVRRVQQLSGPAMAKGVEDTAHYRYTRFVALNEVGGSPATFGADLASFHERAHRRGVRWPLGMVTTSTHDTKRSEDVRARLAVLSEIPEEWSTILHRWCERSRQWWQPAARREPELDVLMHQTLLGAHPLDARRAHAYLDKAMREAKTATSWLDPDPEFERAAHAVMDAMLHDPVHVAELQELADRLLVPGRVNSLAQKLLALTMPGVPDLYQGSELWNLHLVDPDNRQPVDFALRRRLLEEVIDRPDLTRWRATLADPLDPGLSKLALVHHAIAVRRRHADCFTGAASAYAELPVDGPASAHVVAFARGDRVATVVPRLTVKLERAGGWKNTAVTLPAGSWVDVFTGAERVGRVDVDQLLADFPVSLLERR